MPKRKAQEDIDEDRADAYFKAVDRPIRLPISRPVQKVIRWLDVTPMFPNIGTQNNDLIFRAIQPTTVTGFLWNWSGECNITQTDQEIVMFWAIVIKRASQSLGNMTGGVNDTSFYTPEGDLIAGGYFVFGPIQAQDMIVPSYTIPMPSFNLDWTYTEVGSIASVPPAATTNAGTATGLATPTIDLEVPELVIQGGRTQWICKYDSGRTRTQRKLQPGDEVQVLSNVTFNPAGFDPYRFRGIIQLFAIE